MKRGFGFLCLLIFFSFSISVLAQGNTVTFNGTISELTIGTGMNRNVLNLSEHFSSNNTITYKYKAGVDGIGGLIIEIGSDGRVNIEASDSGSRSAIFIADDDITAVQSNDVKIKITGESIVRTSFSPNTESVQIEEGKGQVFAVSGNKSVEWYLDNAKLNQTGNLYDFTGGVGLHTIRAVVDGEQKIWNVSVLSSAVTSPPPVEPEEVEQQGPVCGNNVRESGENCSNCASDVKCSANTECVNGSCVPVKQKSKLILWLGLFAAVIVFVVMAVIFLRKKNIGAGAFDKIKGIFKKEKKREIKIEEERIEKIEEVDLNPLIFYFKNNLGKYEREDLINQALGQGWTQEQVEKALSMMGEKNDESGDDKKFAEEKQ